MKTTHAISALIVLSAIPLVCQAKNPVPQVPREAGLYTVEGARVIQVEGQAVSFHRTGSLVMSGLTAGIKTAKINVQILGKRASLVLDSLPIFYYRTPPKAQAIGQTAGDLLLVRLQVKHGRRQIEVGARGFLRGSTGVSVRWQIQTKTSEVAPGLYRIQPVKDLKTGQYGFYMFRGEGLPPYLFPFGVEGSTHGKKHRHLF